MLLDNVFQYGVKRINWKYTFCLWPRKSSIGNKIIWGKHAYKGVLMIAGPGDPVFITYWITKEEFLIEKLRGRI